MTILASDAIAEVVDRLAPKLAIVGLAEAEDGSWPSLAAPLTWAAGKLLHRPMAALVTNEDLAPVADFAALCDLTEYGALKKIRSRWTKVTETTQSRSKNNSDLLDDIAKRVGELEKLYAALIGPPVDNFVISAASSGLWSYRPGDIWWGWGDEFERW
jgi:hypothetical protein